MKCKQPGCGEDARFSNIETPKIKFCNTHKESNMLDLSMRYCATEGCGTSKPKWIRPNEQYKKYCATCRKTDKTMYNPEILSCFVENCNEPGKTKDGLDPNIGYCIDHKSLANPKQKCSSTEKCTAKTTIYGYVDNHKQKFCKQHKKDDMINLASPRCEFEGCSSINPVFGIPGGKPKFCKTHASDDMKNIVTKKCAHSGCDTVAVFADPNNKSIKFCEAHSSTNMKNVVATNLCKEEGCDSQTSYGQIIKGKNIITHCSTHGKKLGFINLTKPQCAIKNCNTVPTYNIPTEERGKYCATHADKDTMIDVVNNKCIVCRNTVACFGDPETNKLTHCKKHFLPGMIDLKHKKCEEPECESRAAWGYKGEIMKFCSYHADTKTMMDLANRGQLCKLCDLIHATKKYDWLCFGCYCWEHRNDDIQIVRNHLVKERQIMSDIGDMFPNIVRDNKVVGGCSKYRPDGLLRLPDYNIIIEIDENQHNNISYSCEDKRIMTLFMDLGNSPLTVIRFNPDRYGNEESLFKLSSKLGKLSIRDQHKYDLAIKQLGETIQFNIENVPTKEINVVFLRYDTK